jgi:hypothetical protein
MTGMKLVNASEVIINKKISKVEIKKVSKRMKIITDEDQKNIVDGVSGNGIAVKSDIVVRPNTVKSDTVATTGNTIKTGTVEKTDIGNRIIRAIKLKEDIYYGPKNANKNKFMRIYKKLGLKWITDISVNGMMVDGWFNSDRSQYIIKLLEDGDQKRFKFCGCDEIYDYFMSLGGVVFDHNKEDSLSANYQNNRINNAGGIKEISISGVNNVSNVNSAKNIEDTDENYRFLGADLWSGYRTRQLLKKVPDNWGVIWK